MGKRKKGRCAKKNKNALEEPEELVQAPHSFVIHKGERDGHNISELTKDFRKVMEPFTASHLKARKKNTIKDFVSIAGPLHVSHLSIFSRSEFGLYLKIARMPRGPTLTFKVHNYSLSRDVISSLKKQLVVDDSFKHSPLIVLNSFSGEGMQMKLMASMFQNMFPTINLTKVDLNAVRRCVLMSYNPNSKLIDFRHYNIKIVPVGISKGIKKVVGGKVPNLNKCNDISEFFTKTGLLSESEADDENNHVTLPQKIISRGNVESGKSSIRLSELGPRLTLQLIKIEDGLLDGEVLYHELIEKTEDEKEEIRKKRVARLKLKEKRKKMQSQNAKRKEEEKKELKEKSLKGMKKTSENSNPNPIEEERQKEMEIVDDDAEYYRQEVGEEPDQDMFSSQPRGVKRPKTVYGFKRKKIKLDEQQNNKKFNRKNERKDFKPKHKENRDKKKVSFKTNNKFKKKFDKTNSQNRDHRPIGGKSRRR